MKIFVTVGSLFPFDRLITEMDAWCEKRKEHEVVAQIGKSGIQPQHMKSFELLHAAEYNRIFNESDLIISHAGMGVILKALVNYKPLLVIPRKVEFNEVTTDHQLATAKIYDRLGYLNVAWDNPQLVRYLQDTDQIKPRKQIQKYASGQLISSLKEFIECA